VFKFVCCVCVMLFVWDGLAYLYVSSRRSICIAVVHVLSFLSGVVCVNVCCLCEMG